MCKKWLKNKILRSGLKLIQKLYKRLSIKEFFVEYWGKISKVEGKKPKNHKIIFLKKILIENLWKENNFNSKIMSGLNDSNKYLMSVDISLNNFGTAVFC